MGEFLDLSLASFLLTMLRAVVALVLLWCLLRLVDRAVGFDFGQWLIGTSGSSHDEDVEKTGNENQTAVAMYLGARFVGACILFGLLFS